MASSSEPTRTTVTLFNLALTPEDQLVEDEKQLLERQGLKDKKVAYGAEHRTLTPLQGRVHEVREKFSDQRIITMARQAIYSTPTMNVKEYINFRYSQACQKDILTADVIELFPGTIDELATCYPGKPVTLYANPTSTQVAVFISDDGHTEFKKVVFYNIFSESRINNTLQVIRSIKNINRAFPPIETKIIIRGDVARDLANKSALFAQKCSSRIDANSTLVVGARKAPSAFYKEKMGYDVYATIESGGFKYDILKKPGARDIVTLRMPNGDLAYHAVKALLETGKISEVTMVGAGGGFPNQGLEVGAYNFCTSASMDDDETIDLNKHGHIRIKGVDIAVRDALPEERLLVKTGKNVTVNSPLEEDSSWLSRHSAFGNVDVETFHIFKAITEVKSREITVTPGVFISDVLGQHPLTEKISTEDAWQHMDKLLGLARRAPIVFG